jgi:hypothetical protein
MPPCASALIGGGSSTWSILNLPLVLIVSHQYVKWLFVVRKRPTGFAVSTKGLVWGTHLSFGGGPKRR